jgi:hypothetical protein
MRLFRIGGVWLVTACVVFLSSVSAVASASGSGWSVQPTPNAMRFPRSQMFGVSCTSASACVAVGASFDLTSRSRTLAERWNGSKWAIQPTPNPGGAGISVLSGVSCVSASDCIAVGSSYIARSDVALIEHWDGRKWEIQHIPRSARPNSSELLAVSCADRRGCTAVGDTFAGSDLVALAERWNGRTWRIQHTPNPEGRATVMSLRDVSCPSRNTCTAVGSVGTRTLSERWNGHNWTIQPTQNSRHERNELLSVSCASAQACLAVGDGFDCAPSGGCVTVQLAERWHDHEWKLQRTPKTRSTLSGVACASAPTCTAVGDSASGTLAERWNGTNWTTQPTPSSTGTNTALVSVSCPSATGCTAVGDYFNGGSGKKTLAERWQG